jgi:adenylate cyclase
VWVAFALATHWQVGQRIELLGFDALTVASAPSGIEAPIVIVGIDEASFAELDRQWPWPRRLHARLIDRLHAAGATVIGLDVLFAEPANAEDDRLLAEAIKRVGNVVLAAELAVQDDPRFQMAMRVEPIPLLRRAGAVSGLASVSLGPDLVVRAIPQDAEAFWRQVARRYRPSAPGLEPTKAKLARYLGRPHAFRYVSYYQALDPDKYLPPDSFRGKIVLVGHDSTVPLGSGSEKSDAHATPFTASSGMLSPGIEVHATFIANALGGLAIRQAPWYWGLGLAAVALLVMARAARQWRPLRAGLLALGLMAVFAGTALWLFVASQVWLPVASLLLAIVGMYIVQVAVAFVRERISRIRLRRMFARYISPNRVAYLVEHPETLRLGGVRRECSFVFTDLTGFTSLMENIEPEMAVALLNEYLDQMVAIAFSHDGTLDRVVGDAIAIMFSAPVVQPDHRQRALSCALAMQAFSNRFAADAQARGIAFGMTRIGVHTGMVTVGNFGGRTIFDYRALGDPVNTAARLESVNKQLGTQICVSEDTLSGCSDVEVRPIGQLVLRGKSHGVMVYEPISASDPVAPIPRYVDAYLELRRGSSEALVKFRRLASEWPGDGLVNFHVRRLENGQWGTEIVFTEK